MLLLHRFWCEKIEQKRCSRRDVFLFQTHNRAKYAAVLGFLIGNCSMIFFKYFLHSFFSYFMKFIKIFVIVISKISCISVYLEFFLKLSLNDSSPRKSNEICIFERVWTGNKNTLRRKKTCCILEISFLKVDFYKIWNSVWNFLVYVRIGPGPSSIDTCLPRLSTTLKMSGSTWVDAVRSQKWQTVEKRMSTYWIGVCHYVNFVIYYGGL